jgi:hypothetical protein
MLMKLDRNIQARWENFKFKFSHRGILCKKLCGIQYIIANAKVMFVE